MTVVFQDRFHCSMPLNMLPRYLGQISLHCLDIINLHLTVSLFIKGELLIVGENGVVFKINLWPDTQDIEYKCDFGVMCFYVF